MQPQELTKIEKIALEILCVELGRPNRSVYMSPEELTRYIDDAFIQAYQFFDVSHSYTRKC